MKTLFCFQILFEEVTDTLIPDIAGISKIRLLIHLQNLILPKIKQLSCSPSQPAPNPEKNKN